MGLGNLQSVTRDYVRHGITTLFTELDVFDGEVLTRFLFPKVLFRLGTALPRSKLAN